MKIGLISDIHSNLENLFNALALLEAHQVDAVLCAGDLIQGEADDDEVINVLREREVPCVRGNHDDSTPRDQEYMLKWVAATDPMAEMALLSEQTVAFVKALPLTLTFEFEGRRVLVAHGTPWSNTTYVFPTSDTALYERLVNEAQADIIVLGHTHMPMCKSFGAAWVINPGSVHTNRTDGRPSCAILDLAPFGVHFYDVMSGNLIRSYGQE